MSEQEKNTKLEVKEEKADKWDIIITVLLGLTTILGALGAYFSALWGGVQNSNYIQSVTHTNIANTTYLEALNDLSSYELGDLKDDLIYTEWKKGDADAPYYFSKLSEGLQKDLQDNPEDVTEYEKEQTEKLQSIEAMFVEASNKDQFADSLLQKGEEANANGDDFTLTTVLFTVVLFFLGLASLKTKGQIRRLYVIFAVVILFVTIIKMVTIPFPPL
jgi:hypothetical protein